MPEKPNILNITEEILKIMNLMDLESMCGSMVRLMKVNGRKEKWRVMGSSIGKNKDSSIKVNIKMISNMEKEQYIGI